MSKLRVHLPLAALCLASTIGLAAGQAATPEADATFELADAEVGSFLKVEGKVPNLPDGTKLHVRLVEEKSGVEGAFFSTPVTKERFAARRNFDRRKLAPLVYKITVELILPDQRKAIGDYIRREWALPSGARVVLATKEVEIGSLEDQAAFRLESIKALIELTGTAQGTCKRVHDVVSAPMPEDKGALRRQFQELGKTFREEFVKPFDAYRTRYVLIPEQVTVDSLLSVMTSISKPLKLYAQGEQGKAVATNEASAAVLKRTLDELKSRLPKESGEDSK